MTRTPITIVTGYLGSGKTTLLRQILDQTDRRLAIVMNEFGEVGIDGRILQGKNVNMVELSGGCVCCSLTGEFEAAVREIVSTINPEAIVVETTGVAEPDALIVNVQDSIPEVRLDSVVTIVDADGMLKFPSLGHTGRVQIEMADLILINKTDLIPPEKWAEVESKVREVNERAALVNTVRCNIDTGLLFGTRTVKKTESKVRRHLEEEQIEAFTYSSLAVLDRERFEEFLGSLPREIYRAKGFVNFRGGQYLVNYVAGRWEFEEFQGNRNQLVFIGKNANDHQGRITELLRDCEIKM